MTVALELTIPVLLIWGVPIYLLLGLLVGAIAHAHENLTTDLPGQVAVAVLLWPAILATWRVRS